MVNFDPVKLYSNTIDFNNRNRLGVPSCQRTIAFEKACVLFNIGALYTQIGAKQDLTNSKCLDAAVDSFLRAAGTFKYICENFTNAPSMDLGPEMLEMLVQLMLAQARECLFQKLEIQSETNRSTTISLDLTQEASQVALVFQEVTEMINDKKVGDYVPYSWRALLHVKHEYYSSLAHYHCSRAILESNDCYLDKSVKDTLQYLHETTNCDKPQVDILVPNDEGEQKLLGKAHVREALVRNEEAQRLQRMCRELKNKKSLTKVLARLHNEIFSVYSLSEQEDDFRQILDPPKIRGNCQGQKLSKVHVSLNSELIQGQKVLEIGNFFLASSLKNF